MSWIPLKIDRIVSKGQYNYAVVPGHPNATKHNYVLEHRVVIENHYQRFLYANEVVHHKNGNKKDNRLCNLELMTDSEHRAMHGKAAGRALIDLKCPTCGALFTRRKGHTHLDKRSERTFCSRRCNGKFNRSIQQSSTDNVVAVYRSYTT
jgi:uncharacterized C2H2 Zn-finger protein